MDLAGSERIKRTGMEGGTLLREAKHINLSLHFLEQVIVALQVSCIRCTCPPVSHMLHVLLPFMHRSIAPTSPMNKETAPNQVSCRAQPTCANL